jgi:hypothetical protein
MIWAGWFGNSFLMCLRRVAMFFGSRSTKTQWVKGGSMARAIRGDPSKIVPPAVFFPGPQNRSR